MPALMIAGPGQLHDEDLEALGQQVIAHYGDLWVELHTQLLDSLKELLNSDGHPYVIPGTGTTCLDAAIGNLFEEGQKVVVADTGFFGQRLMQIARAHRLEVIEVPVEVGAPADPVALGEAAEAADGLLTVHVETATGIAHPIGEIGAAAAEAGAAYMVDAIASVGGETVDVEGMGIDALVTSTQKGLEAPPGLGIIALSSRGRKRLRERRESPRAWYLDLEVWDRYREEWGAWHPHPVTMPTNLVLALASSVKRILAEGIDDWVKQRAELAAYCRTGLEKIGLRSVAPAGYGANLCVAAWAEDPDAIIQRLLADGIMISGGLPPIAGEAIRVGLMGRTATYEMVDRVIEGAAAAIGR
jgi:alanine-glyoxylate transaminase/serine-glyoxylate transaminase/serine-pyruvate transaminase